MLKLNREFFEEVQNELSSLTDFFRMVAKAIYSSPIPNSENEVIKEVNYDKLEKEGLNPLSYLLEEEKGERENSKKIPQYRTEKIDDKALEALKFYLVFHQYKKVFSVSVNDQVSKNLNLNYNLLRAILAYTTLGNTYEVVKKVVEKLRNYFITETSESVQNVIHIDIGSNHFQLQDMFFYLLMREEIKAFTSKIFTKKSKTPKFNFFSIDKDKTYLYLKPENKDFKLLQKLAEVSRYKVDLEFNPNIVDVFAEFLLEETLNHSFVEKNENLMIILTAKEFVHVKKPFLNAYLEFLKVFVDKASQKLLKDFRTIYVVPVIIENKPEVDFFLAERLKYFYDGRLIPFEETVEKFIDVLKNEPKFEYVGKKLLLGEEDYYYFVGGIFKIF